LTDFDDIDVDFVSKRFDIPQLRRELDIAKSRLAVAICLDEDEEAAFYEGYLEVVQVALKTKQGPAPKLLPGMVNAETIKKSTDIVDVAERYTTLKKNGSRFKGSCPLHSDNSPSFVVYPDQQSWWCYQCNQGGDVFLLVQMVEKTDFKGALAILGAR